MSEYTTRLVDTKIVSFKSDFSYKEETKIDVCAQFRAGVHPPANVSDPTAMVKVECTLSDEQHSIFEVSCVVEMIYQISPTPRSSQKYADIISSQCRTEIQEEILRKTSEIAEIMGYKLNLDNI